MSTVLFNVSYLIEVEDNLLNGSDEAEAFKENVFQKLSNYSGKKIDAKHKAEWNSSTFLILDPSLRILSLFLIIQPPCLFLQAGDSDVDSRDVNVLIHRLHHLFCAAHVCLTILLSPRVDLTV